MNSIKGVKMNKKYSNNKKSQSSYKRPKPHPNTDMKAWEKAYNNATSKNGNGETMSSLYYKYKKENERKDLIKTILSKTTFTSPSAKRKHTSQKPTKKYISKETLFDKLRNYRSSEIVSYASDSVAKFIVHVCGKSLSNSQKDLLRSLIALATSETINKIFEEEISTIENLQTFVKWGNTVYRIFLTYNDKLHIFTIDENRIYKCKENSIRYKCFLKHHPTLKQIYTNELCLSLDDFKSDKVCLIRKKLETLLAKSEFDSNDAPNGCPYYYLCNSL